MQIGKKILVMGGSCSGKSTMSQALSEKFNIPVLYLDLYDPYAVNDKQERDKRKQQIQDMIGKTIQSKSWVIDGIYEWYNFTERMDMADTIILLKQPALPRIWRYIKTCATKTKRHGRSGFSAKNFRFDHIWYMLRRADAPYKQIQDEIKKHKNLQVIVLKSYREANEFLKNVQIKVK